MYLLCASSDSLSRGMVNAHEGSGPVDGLNVLSQSQSKISGTICSSPAYDASSCKRTINAFEDCSVFMISFAGRPNEAGDIVIEQLSERTACRLLTSRQYNDETSADLAGSHLSVPAEQRTLSIHPGTLVRKDHLQSRRRVRYHHLTTASRCIQPI